MFSAVSQRNSFLPLLPLYQKDGITQAFIDNLRI